MPETFSKKLETAFKSAGQLCVGIDPHEELLLENGYEVSAEGVLYFGLKMLDQLADVVSMIKPQVSFFERFGSEGFKSLELLLRSANERGFLVIADAKRGDIGSTMEAYGQAWLAKSAPFICDALTVNPYLGVGSLAPAIAMASERGKGLFVLAATSNPEGRRLQSSKSESETVARQVADEVAKLNKTTAASDTRFGHLGLVVGATVKLDEVGLKDLNKDSASLRTSILAPGFGFQGAALEDARKIFGSLADDGIYTISRSALRNGLAGVKQTVRDDQQILSSALSQ